MSTSVSTARTDAAYDRQTEFLIFASEANTLAIRSDQVVSVIDTPPVTRVPRMPQKMRGVINYMGAAISLYDLRKCADRLSLEEECSATVRALEARKQDHLRWLQKLKTAVDNGDAIDVETDPHRCAFGRWFDAYQTQSMTLRRYIDRFDEPHRKIHEVAIRAAELIGGGAADEAKRLIQETEQGDLARLVELFDQAEAAFTSNFHEYTVVTETLSGKQFGIAADRILRFGRFDNVVHPLPPQMQSSRATFVEALGQSSGEDTQTLIMDLESFLAVADCR